MTQQWLLKRLPVTSDPQRVFLPVSMSRLVRCTCRSHCLIFNPQTQSYEGEGGLVPKSTASNHLQDDLRFQTLDAFTESVATRVLSYSPPTGFSNQYTPPPGSCNQPPPDDLYSVLEVETAYRCTWAPINHSLVFAADPSPTLPYRYPSILQLHTPNREPYALDPANPANAAYLENESRLCEILVTLGRGPVSEGRDRLTARVHEGFLAMELHKEKEWNRQRAGSIARDHGYSVVDTGPLVPCLPEIPLSLTDSEIRLLFQ